MGTAVSVPEPAPSRGQLLPPFPSQGPHSGPLLRSPEGGAWDRSDPGRGWRELEKGPPPPRRVPCRLLGAAPFFPEHNFSITPARDSGDKEPLPRNLCRYSQSCERNYVPMCPGFPLPPRGLAPPSALALPRLSDPLSPRGLGATARDVQTQLSARAIDSRIAFGQSRAAARGGGGRRTGGTGEWRHHAEAGTHTLNTHTHTHTHTRWGPSRGGGVRVWGGGWWHKGPNV